MIQSLENRMPHFDRWSQGDQGLAMTESVQARLSQSQTTDVVFYTQEGDKVTLSSSTQYQAKYATYEGFAGVGNIIAWEQSESFEISTGSHFSFTVEGNLNAQEKADIKKALKTIDKIMTDLLSGESDKAMERVAKLSRLGTLQSLSADLQVHQDIYYEHQETAIMAAEARSRESNPPVDRFASGISDRLAPSDASTTAEAAAVNDITDAVRASGEVKGKLLSLLNRYFSELEKGLAEGEADVSDKATIIDRVKSGLLEHIADYSTKGQSNC